MCWPASLSRPLQTVADRLAEQLHDLRFQHAVQHITWGSGSLAAGGDDSSTSSGCGGVSIACANGATLEADVALVTLPLGVLKTQHRRLFSPPLPPAKVAAIERMRIGTVDKLFLDFTPPTGSSGNGSTGGTRQSHWRQRGRASCVVCTAVELPLGGC